MPQLKLVLACEKVIYDQDGPASAISIFESMKFRLQDAPLPERAVVPNLWAIFTIWEPEPHETGQQFAQTVKVFAPDGSLFFENDHTVVVPSPEHIQLRMRINVRTLPVWQQGKVQVKVFLKGSDVELGSTCFNIVYLPKEENAQPIEPKVELD